MSGYSDAPIPASSAHTVPLAFDKSPLQPVRLLGSVLGIKRPGAGDASVPADWSASSGSGSGSEMDMGGGRPKAVLPRSRSGPAAFSSAASSIVGLAFEHASDSNQIKGDQKRLRRLPSCTESETSDQSNDDLDEESFMQDRDMANGFDPSCTSDIHMLPNASKHPKLAGALAALQGNATPCNDINANNHDDHDMPLDDNDDTAPCHPSIPSASRSLSHARLAALNPTPPRRPLLPPLPSLAPLCPTSPNVRVDRFGRRLTAPDGEDMAEERTKMLQVHSSFVKVDEMGNRVRRGVGGVVGRSGLRNSRVEE